MALSGVWSPPVTGTAGQWLPGLSKGEEEKGDGGGWAQQDTLRGRRKLAGRRNSLGRGRRLQGPREPQWRNRAQRRLRKRLSPAEGSQRQNSAQVTSPPPSYVPLHGMPRCSRRRNSGRSALRLSLTAATRGELEETKGLLFLDSSLSLASCFSFPPPVFFFFAFCHIMRLGATDVISVGALSPTHVLPGARDAGREGSAECCQNADRVVVEMWSLVGMEGCWTAVRNGGAAPFPCGPCLFKPTPLRRERGVGRWAQPPALSVTQGNGLPAERSLGSWLQHSSPA